MTDAGIETTEQPVKKDDLEAYWLQKLGDELPVLDIKLDRSHLGAGTSSSSRVGIKKSASIQLEKGLHSKLAGFVSHKVSHEAYQHNHKVRLPIEIRGWLAIVVSKNSNLLPEYFLQKKNSPLGVHICVPLKC